VLVTCRFHHDERQVNCNAITPGILPAGPDRCPWLAPEGAPDGTYGWLDRGVTRWQGLGYS
jgi:hypothetical protein